jgi:hypothetical protein
MCEALGSTPSTKKKKRKEKRIIVKRGSWGGGR